MATSDRADSRITRFVVVLAPLLAYALRVVVAADEQTCALTRSGKPACVIVTTARQAPELPMERAVASIADTVRRWGGVDLPVVALSEGASDLPGGSSIVLTTLARLRRIAPAVATSNEAMGRVAFLDEHGYVCVPVSNDAGTRMFVVGRTLRGVHNGAVYLRDFLIDGTKDDLFVRLSTAIRSPQMRGRAVYTLTIWKWEAEYAAEDWEKIFNAFARDGFNRVYFWISGHFPSKRFPQTYKVANGPYDTTVKSKIGTVDDLHRIIRYGHQLGLDVYIGGAMGGWVGTRFITNLEPDTIKTGPTLSLCPSHPKVRQALTEYYREMFDALPEADGVYLESADEDGECRCPACAKSLDNLGSRQFGQAQLTLLQKIASTIWRDHPHARFAYTIGYSPHTRDPAYYETIRQMSSDPRFEWMEARESWEFPGPQGQKLPVSYFSRQVMHWSQYYAHPLDRMVTDANRIIRTGFDGAIYSFEPGFGTGSFYSQIPFPTHLLPYVLTGFVFREATWEPTLSAEAMRRRVQQRFFGREAPPQLSRDFWQLREIIRSSCCGKPGVSPEHAQVLDEIENRVVQARAGAGPKTLESLDLMMRAINDTRGTFKLERRR